MKDFIIIGNSNAVISKDIFPHIRDGKVRLVMPFNRIMIRRKDYDHQGNN